jgi:hypothetical protein
MLTGDPAVETPCGDSKAIAIAPDPAVVGGVMETLKN